MSETGTKDWKVVGVREGKTEPNPHGGNFQKFYVDFEGSDDTYWRRKEGDTPEVGKSYYGTISEGNYGPMFKKEKRPDGSHGGSSAERTTGGQRDWKPESQYDPEKTARIGRAHSQEMALRWATLIGDKETLTLPALFKFADAFERDVDQAGQAASQASGSAAPNEGASTSSAPSPASDSRPANDEHTDIEMALDSAGLMNSAARLLVTNYMLQELSEERRSKAFSMLRNPAEQAETLKKLERLTEGWHGESLPTDASGPMDEPDIPFARPEYREPFSERERWRF